MKLTITDEAVQQIHALQPKDQTYLRLESDTEGCGCGVNGVQILYFTNVKTEHDEEVENDHFSIIIDEQQKIFFHPTMTLEWNKSLFRLKSPNGMLNPSLSSSQILQGVRKHEEVE